MKFSFRLKRICGNVYGNGNLTFTPDGNAIISPVGNRVTIYDVMQQSSSTLPFENRKNIKRIAVSNTGRFLISIDVEGHALLINLPRRVVIHRMNFKQKVMDVKFSPDDKLFAVTYRHGFQIWRTPSATREFSPLVLSRTITAFHNDTVCIDWSADSRSIICGAKDLSARIYNKVDSPYMSCHVLSGHRDLLVGSYFAKDGDSAFTIARDGAVFTWHANFTEETVEVVIQNARSAAYSRRGSDDDEESDADSTTSESVLESSERSETAIKETRIRKKVTWTLQEREFLWDPHVSVESTGFNSSTGLLVIGFSNGVFGVYEMPGCVNIHKLSVSNHTLNAAAINTSGEWLAIGSSKLGQLLVWEWQSETYVLKQQGHVYGLNALEYSNDGQFIATGGEDSKVKLWNATSGFCVVTFSTHLAPVTGVKFVGKGAGKAVISSSLDGTIRAHDLMRYKNFRTLTTPTPMQFTCLAVDSSGEVVCAGAMDPFNIYVWSLQTGQLLDVLAGHEAPIACLDFSVGIASSGALSSGSWDGTLKLWDVYKNTCMETFEHGCDVLAVAFRPDGLELATATTNGYITFWEVESGTQLSVIEGRRDISGGRLTTDATTADNSSRSKYFTTLCYTADGKCMLAAGRSKYACIYAVATGVLIKKFQLSHNRSLEGILDELRSDRMVDGVALDNLTAGNSDDDHAVSSTPGAGVASGAGGGQRGKSGLMDGGSRTTRPEVLTSAIRFSPSGRDWAAATTQGLQVFSVDDAMLFAPTDLEEAITPQAVRAALARDEFPLALNMALHLGERDMLKVAVDAVSMRDIELVLKTLDVRMLHDLLKFLSEELMLSKHLEYYMRWTWEIMRLYGDVLQMSSTTAVGSGYHARGIKGSAEVVGGSKLSSLESMRSLIRAVSTHEREIVRMGDDNQFNLLFLCSQLAPESRAQGSSLAFPASSRSSCFSSQQLQLTIGNGPRAATETRTEGETMRTASQLEVPLDHIELSDEDGAEDSETAVDVVKPADAAGHVKLDTKVEVLSDPAVAGVLSWTSKNKTENDNNDVQESQSEKKERNRKEKKGKKEPEKKKDKVKLEIKVEKQTATVKPELEAAATATSKLDETGVVGEDVLKGTAMRQQQQLDHSEEEKTAVGDGAGSGGVRGSSSDLSSGSSSIGSGIETAAAVVVEKATASAFVTPMKKKKRKRAERSSRDVGIESGGIGGDVPEEVEEKREEVMQVDLAGSSGKQPKHKKRKEGTTPLSETPLPTPYTTPEPMPQGFSTPKSDRLDQRLSSAVNSKTKSRGNGKGKGRGEDREDEEVEEEATGGGGGQPLSGIKSAKSKKHVSFSPKLTEERLVEKYIHTLRDDDYEQSGGGGFAQFLRRLNVAGGSARTPLRGKGGRPGSKSAVKGKQPHGSGGGGGGGKRSKKLRKSL